VEARNPYLILGIPFGATREQANIAFARRTKALRRAGGQNRDQLTDLTWALNQLDQIAAHAETVLDVYRIPASAETFTSPGPGVLSPPPEPLPPRGGDRDAALAHLALRANHELLRYLVLLHSGQVAAPTP
jgi:hypothetical protein